MAKDLRNLLEKGGFKLTKWLSNDRDVLQTIPEEERAKGIKEINLEKDNLPVERALGVTWCIETDNFGFKIAIKDHSVSRRGILSVASSVYDPLGIIAPVVLPAKILLQDLCRKGLDWDSEISVDDCTRWQTWLSDLPKLGQFSFKRCIKPQGFDNIVSTQIHHFSDSSESAYGCASYVRYKNSDGQLHCSLLFGKSRLVPLKQITIPRLELATAALSVRSSKMLKKELEISVDNHTFWTDSTTVLNYVNLDSRRFKTYVANRVAYIRDATSSSQWKYVNTSCNPADYASRGMKVDCFLKSQNWVNGPDFL